MAELEDPVTGVDYDLTRPGKTAKQAVMVVGGLAMTILLFGIANNQVAPAVSDLINGLTGGALSTGNETGAGAITFGDPN